MKKVYFEPEIEEILLNTQISILATSEGGINDDFSANTDDDYNSDDPKEDFGW